MPEEIKEIVVIADQAKTIAKAYGQRLGFLISVLNVAEEVKEAMLELVAAMTLEQIERFCEILENGFILEQTSEIDRAFVKELEHIKEEYEEEQVSAVMTAEKKLLDLEKRLLSTTHSQVASATTA